MANQGQFPNHEIVGIQNLKKKIASMKSHQKVQIQSTKKLDRMFWLLLEQNQDVKNNITNYKEKYRQKTYDGRGLASHTAGNAAHGETMSQGGNDRGLVRRQTSNVRSHSGVGTASPKITAMSSLNVLGGAGLISSKHPEGKHMRQSAVAPLA